MMFVFISTVLRAFADVETVESMYALTRGSRVTPLSIQEMLDCSYNYDGVLASCYGGDTCYALDWMKKVGTVSVIALHAEMVIVVLYGTGVLPQPLILSFAQIQ